MLFEIDSVKSIPYMQCKEASIYPLADGDHVGKLNAAVDGHEVRIKHETNPVNEKVLRVWARVFLGKAPKQSIDECALYIAERSKESAAWEPVKTDLRDGEVSYMKTWTTDYPDDAAMDEFFANAKQFIESQTEFLHTMLTAD